MLDHLPDAVRRAVFQRSLAARACSHTANVADVGEDRSQPATCPSCEARGISWLKLRMCMTCGNVGCCDSSAGHARAHFEATGHPLMRSIEPGETWAWCYPDQAYLGSVPIPT